MVADFSDPTAPVSMGSLRPSDYLQSGYNHSGWLSEDGSTYFMADEDHGMDLKVLDVTALPDLTVVDTIDAGNESRFSYRIIRSCTATTSTDPTIMTDYRYGTSQI